MQANFPVWILISDSSRARLYSLGALNKPMVLREEFDHAASRAKEHDLVTDKPGRMSQSTAGSAHPGHGSRSSMDPGTSAKEMEHERFARTLTDELNAQFNQNAYARLIVAANPEFLGILRELLSDQVKKNLITSLNKDYTHLAVKELQEHLAPHLAA